MKLTMIRRDGRDVAAAVLADGRLLDLNAAQRSGLLGGAPIVGLMDVIALGAPGFPLVRALVDAAEAGTIGDRADDAGVVLDGAGVEYARTLNPGKIISCGMAYKAHLDEMKVTTSPTRPVAFLKNPGAITSHGQPVVLPRQDPDMVDFECEFACVIGRAFHKISAEEALDHVAGYTMINDIGSRTHTGDFVAGLNGLQSSQAFMEAYVESVLEKQYPTFCPLGPVIHTADTFGDPGDVQVETRLNGEVMQSAHTSDLIFDLAYSLAYYSRWYRFEPGDVLTTGSPPGVGMGRNPPRYLRPGDVLETSGSRIGTLINPVILG